MTRVIRRFAAVGTLATAIDVTAFLILRVGFRLPVVVAALAAVALATPVSYSLNRWITFADDPYLRWVHQPASYVLVAVAGSAVDVAVLAAAAAAVDAGFAYGALLAARAAGLAAGGVVRGLGYRIILFDRVREEQTDRVARDPAPGALRLSVVVPAYNEEPRIADTVARIRTALAAVGGDIEIIVVDDGSGDATARVAAAAGGEVVQLPSNCGKGAAVRAGVKAARGRTIAYTDADLSYAPEQLVGLLERIEDGWDVVVGSRGHIDTRTLVATGRVREVTGRLFNLMTYLVLLGRYRDTQCGLKAFRSDVAGVLFSHARLDRFAFDVELFHLAERYHLSLVELPVTVAHSNRSSVRVARDAARMVRDLFRVRWWAGRGVYELTPAEAAVLER
jgi:putative flippase GtrA